MDGNGIESRRAGRVFGAIFGQGLHLATLYCAVGLTLELLHGILPADAYGKLAAGVYGLPMRLLMAMGLESRLVSEVAHGALPAWIAKPIACE